MNKKYAPNSTFLPSAVALATDFDSHANTPWLSDYRQSAVVQLQSAVFPSPQVEHFKYNRFHAFDSNDFATLAKAITAENIADFDLTTRAIADLEADAERIVFVNGLYSSVLSQHSDHAIVTFADADNAQQNKITALLASQKTENNLFTAVNASLTDNGVLIEISENSPKTVIEVLSIIDASAINHTLASQVLIDVADGCKARIINRAINWEDSADATETALSTQRVVANIGESAKFEHYHLQLENPHSLHFGSVCYNLQSHAELRAFSASTGGNLKKLDIEVNHLGQHAFAGLNGLYVAGNDEQIDYHTTVTHPLPNGTTNENFRGIVTGSAEGTFNGRIHIHEDAQKTLAELSNKNLLLSDDAVLHTKPELEIYADDVVCAHGATVSRLTNESLNYLRARGISKAEAEKMLSFAFFDEILGEVENDAIADYLRPILFGWFG